MTMDHDVADQADKLMRRHRIFVAGAPRPTPVTQQTADDLPVLTDMIVASDDEAEQSASVGRIEPIIAPDRIEAMAREMLFERLPTQRQAVAEELSAWLDHELPLVVMRVLDGLTDQLVAQVTAEARAALLPRLQMALEAESQPSPNAD